MSPPRTRPPRALGPVELALLRVSVATTHTRRTSPSSANACRIAHSERTLRSWVLTAVAVGTVLATVSVARLAFTG
jgi:hypothetical protein